MTARRSARTRAARLGEAESRVGSARALADGLHPTTVWAFDDLDAVDAWYEGRSPDTFLYYRNGGPNPAALEAAVADLEGAEAGVAAGSGMAAISGAFLAVAQAGDHIVSDQSVYGGTTVLLRTELARLGIATTFVDATDPAAVAAAIRPTTKIVHVESLSNPLLRCPDLSVLAEIAHRAGAILSVDNTFASPILLRPCEHGADIITHSLAKYLGGHSVAVGGVAVGRASIVAAARDRLIRFGGTIGAFDAWMTLQGMKTLPLRMAAHAQNGARVARALADRADIVRVYYPGLTDHPDHVVASRLFPDGLGGMLSFDVGSAATARAFFAAGAEIGIPLAPSLADTRTTVSYPAGTSHRALSRHERYAIGVTDGLIRLSVGIEDADDIVADLDAALTRAKTA
ncbi:MAG: aminotransferase class I/II-fold pyridoxal phosphate-dependent enzyme [Chloroflexota bacterium]|nr:MAG: aminotransferase class I/II-fold pyridoxal phosphate-dependent enzyme [Chloroflexota bacterium]